MYLVFYKINKLYKNYKSISLGQLPALVNSSLPYQPNNLIRYFLETTGKVGWKDYKENINTFLINPIDCFVNALQPKQNLNE